RSGGAWPWAGAEQSRRALLSRQRRAARPARGVFLEGAGGGEPDRPEPHGRGAGPRRDRPRAVPGRARGGEAAGCRLAADAVSRTTVAAAALALALATAGGPLTAATPEADALYARGLAVLQHAT